MVTVEPCSALVMCCTIVLCKGAGLSKVSKCPQLSVGNGDR